MSDRHEGSRDGDRDTTGPEAGTAGDEKVDGADVAAIQNDDRLTPADRVDLIANQVIPEPPGVNDAQHPNSTP